MTTATKPQDTRGLAGQTVGETGICAVTQTQLIYRGYEIADLAEHASFEEVAFLLLVGRKPSATELQAFRQEQASLRSVPASVRDAVARIAKDRRQVDRYGSCDFDLLAPGPFFKIRDDGDDQISQGKPFRVPDRKACFDTGKHEEI